MILEYRKGKLDGYISLQSLLGVDNDVVLYFYLQNSLLKTSKILEYSLVIKKCKKNNVFRIKVLYTDNVGKVNFSYLALSGQILKVIRRHGFSVEKKKSFFPIHNR